MKFRKHSVATTLLILSSVITACQPKTGTTGVDSEAVNSKIPVVSTLTRSLPSSTQSVEHPNDAQFDIFNIKASGVCVSTLFIALANMEASQCKGSITVTEGSNSSTQSNLSDGTYSFPIGCSCGANIAVATVTYSGENCSLPGTYPLGSFETYNECTKGPQKPRPLPTPNPNYGKPIPRSGGPCVSQGGQFKVHSIYDFHKAGPDISIVAVPEYSMGPDNPDFSKSLNASHVGIRFELPDGAVSSEAEIVVRKDAPKLMKDMSDENAHYKQNLGAEALLSKDELTGLFEIKTRSPTKRSRWAPSSVSYKGMPASLELSHDYEGGNIPVPLTIAKGGQKYGPGDWDDFRRHYAQIIAADLDKNVYVVKPGADPYTKHTSFVDEIPPGQTGKLQVFFLNDRMDLILKKDIVSAKGSGKQSIEWSWQCATQ